MSIFHLKYVQFCPGYKSFQNVIISFEIYVNVFQLIQNVNIPFEKFVNGSVDTENGALAYGACVFYIQTFIFHLKK